jgi:hypothetical protein
MPQLSLLAVPLLVVGLLAGCGDDGGGGAATNATVEEFCQPFVDLAQEFASNGADVSDADALKIAKDTAEKLRKAGTPEDMPEDARKGFELVVEKLGDLDEDATKADVEKSMQLTDEEQKYSDALTRYVTENCADAFADIVAGG